MKKCETQFYNLPITRLFTNKEEPHRNGKALLQLTTYETQSFLWYGAAALSPSPLPERTDMVLTPRSGDMFKIFSNG